MTSVTPGWASRHMDELRATVSNPAPPPYPCHFASAAEHVGGNHYGHVDLTGERAAEVGRLAQELAEYLLTVRARGAYRRATYLCAVGPTGGATLAQDQAAFWALLGDLHAVDTRPWPSSVPENPDDPGWVFCLGGEQIFPFALSPRYVTRRSRRVGVVLTVCFQSVAVFDGISGSTDAGRRAKAKVRQALTAYEDAPLVAAMGDGLSSTAAKWRQYFPDDDGTSPGRCPMATLGRRG